MNIADDKVVSMNYILKNDEGQIMDQSKGTPLVYLHGHRNIVPGLEEALEGLAVGEKKAVKVAAKDGYGELDPKLRFPLPIEKVGKDVPPVNSIVELNNHKGKAFMARVVGIETDRLLLDANHPLAGQNLNFEVEITEVRDATADEIEHGHVHGPG